MTVGRRGRDLPPEPIREAVALERLEPFAEGVDHAEGIAILGDGTIHVGGEEGQVYAVGADGVPREVANVGGGIVLGLAADADGRLYVCNETLAKVFRVDPASGGVELFFAGTEVRPLALPNWPVFDAAGTLYLSDSGGWQEGNGLIWSIRPGRRPEVWSEAVPDFPNGIALDPDGSRLYGVESTPGRIFVIPIDDDGSAGPPEVLQELGSAIVPDGIAVAADGSLVIACYRPDAILRWSEEEGVEVLAADPQGTVLAAPANVAFTGAERDVLVSTNLAARHLVRGRLGVCGTALFSPPGRFVDGG